MPNGGSVSRMYLLGEQANDHVIHCDSDELTVFTREGQPLLTLNKREMKLLERFLRYALHDRGSGLLHEKGAIFDDMQGVMGPYPYGEQPSEAERRQHWRSVQNLFKAAKEYWLRFENNRSE